MTAKGQNPGWVGGSCDGGVDQCPNLVVLRTERLSVRPAGGLGDGLARAWRCSGRHRKESLGEHAQTISSRPSNLRLSTSAVSGRWPDVRDEVEGPRRWPEGDACVDCPPNSACIEVRGVVRLLE